MKSLALALVSMLLLGVGGLAQDADEAKAPAKKEKKPSPRELAKKIDRQEHDLEIAKMKLSLAQLDARVDGSAADAASRKAVRVHERAVQKLSHYQLVVKPRKIEEAMISFDSAKNRAIQAQDEMNELIAMYKAEEFAELTKELVLKRGRHSLEVANRRLKVQTSKMEELKNVTTRYEESDLVIAVETARDALEREHFKNQKAKLKIKISMKEAKRRVFDAEQKLMETQKKLKALS